MLEPFTVSLHLCVPEQVWVRIAARICVPVRKVWRPAVLHAERFGQRDDVALQAETGRLHRGPMYSDFPELLVDDSPQPCSVRVHVDVPYDADHRQYTGQRIHDASLVWLRHHGARHVDSAD